MAESLGSKLKNITGDVLLAAGAVAYLGAFNVTFSSKNTLLGELSLINILGEPVQVRQWQIAGLPKDSFSVENGIIVKNSNRWPLMIDPQDNDIIVVKYSDPEYLLSLANAIQSGVPALLEGVGDNLDPGLESVLLKRTFKNKGSECISVGSQVVEYDPKFRLYILTSLRNPHFPPEDQLLGILAAAEKPELEEMKNKLIVDGAKNKKQLKDIEDKILKVLSTSQGNILEDETAIQILSSSKVLSEEIEAKQEVASKTEEEIDKTRDGYSPVATHASILFFCVSELSQIDPMYQFSLPWFIQIYIKAIKETPSAKKGSKESSGDVSRRISNLNSNFTEIIYHKISRSLLREHVLVFSFILSLRLSGVENWQYVLKDIQSIDHNQPIPDDKWMTGKMWNSIVSISKMKTFQGLMQSLRDDLKDWRAFYEAPNPSKDCLPVRWKEIRDLDYIFLLRIIRPDWVISAIRSFIGDMLGKEFVYPQILNIQNAYEDSDSNTPIILILSPGANPLACIDSIELPSDKSPAFIKSISLGQGQGPKAESLLVSAAREGGWVILQNCHLCTNWMRDRLQSLWEEEIILGVDPRFRLWLTSYPSDSFPPHMLQLSVKVSLQPPNGLKANLSVAYSTTPIVNPDFYDANEAMPLRAPFRRLVYGLAFFHGAVLERLNYNGVGWNDPSYEFTWSDLNISLMQLKDMLLTDRGGEMSEEDGFCHREIHSCSSVLRRVREVFDRRLLSTLLGTCFSQPISNNYCIPGELHRVNVLEIIARLSETPDPDAVGLHFNSVLIRNEEDGRKILNWTYLATRYGEFTDLSNWNLPEMEARDSLNTTLRLEITRYNALLRIALIPEIETAYREVNSNEVLSSWKIISYSSLQTLEHYLLNLRKRIEFFRVWSEGKIRPKLYWISGFYFPQSLLTSVLQNYARKKQIALNQVEFEYLVLRDPEGIDPREGIIIEGIYLEGASWDEEKGLLVEPPRRISPHKLKKGFYECPVYRNEARKGDILATGHSTNYVFDIHLPTTVKKEHWILRGVAGILELRH
ncbi:Dynein beta chain_ ciliary_ putative [Caligus rogercresseyi]|uniref:Dynein beta chain_ ciliary_ putative n=1 Tax=Caligus rogercresseyi TaxID=217165 RepID=A0A7T8KH09_CALRO|nr:Dynein beta chain_ ciliary_ putative [Caligus rogercresseyi]